MTDIKTAVLTAAGSDSGGGAGIQADLRTFSAFKVYGCSAITAVTAQNPDEVRKVQTLSAEIIESQLECILDKIPVKWAKTGMLANRETIECVSEVIKKHQLNSWCFSYPNIPFFFTGGCSFIVIANFSNKSLCSLVNFLGVFTITVNMKSPFVALFAFLNPFPLILNLVSV